MCSVMSFCKLWSSHLASSLSVGKSGFSLARDPYPVMGLVSSYKQGTAPQQMGTLWLCEHSLAVRTHKLAEQENPRHVSDKHLALLGVRIQEAAL